MSLQQLKSRIKEIKGVLQAGDSSAYAQSQALVGEYSEYKARDDTEKLLLCALYVTAGMCATAANDYTSGADCYRKAAGIQPELPQAWKGLYDCLLADNRETETVEPLLHMIKIAEYKSNWQRSRTLRLKAAQVLMDLRKEDAASAQALDILLGHLNNKAATGTDSEAPQERLEMISRVATLDSAVSKTTEKFIQEALENASMLASLHVPAYIVEALVSKLVNIGLEHIIKAATQEGKVAEWRKLLSKCSEILNSGLENVDDARAVLLHGSWFCEDISVEHDSLEEIAVEAIKRRAGGRLGLEAALYLAYSKIIHGEGADEYLKAVDSILRKQSENVSVYIEGDWRLTCVSALAKTQVSIKSASSSHADIQLCIAELRKVSSLVDSCVYGLPSESHNPTLYVSIARAKLLSKIGSRDAAVELLESTSRIDSKYYSSAVCALGEIFLADASSKLSGDDATTAQKYFSSVLQVEPNHCDALIGLAEIHLLHLKDPEKALPLLKRAIDVCTHANARSYMLLGKCYYALGGVYRTDRELCFGAYLQAAKLDSSSSEVFQALGNWYETVAGDSTRAVGCYARALKIDPGLSEAGYALVTLYLKNGQETLALAQCKASASASGQASWAWALLGRAAMAKGDLKEAAAHLQQALTGAPDVWRSWADLGWVYHRQAKQQAALKAYKKALELLEAIDQEKSEEEELASVNGAITVVFTDMGLAYREIGQVDEAVEALESALLRSPKDPSTCVGAALAYLAQAHARSTEGLFGSAAECLRKGIHAVEGLIQSDRASIAALKVAGDLRTYAHRLPPTCFGDAKSRQEFVAAGSKAYWAVVEREQANSEGAAGAHFDLGLSLLLQARMLRAERGEGSGLWESSRYDQLQDVTHLTTQAEASFRSSLSIDPLNSETWVGLGLASKDPLVRQHCFCRAVEIDHNPSGWANLAALYVEYNREEAAYESLNGLQSIVDHPAMWAAMGLLREKAAIAKLSLPELSSSSDAFYACLEATPLLEGLLGLAYTATLTHSLADGNVAISLYCDLNPHNPAAWNVRGILQERSGRPELAAISYGQAISLLAQQADLLGPSREATIASAILQTNRLRALTLANDSSAAEEVACLIGEHSPLESGRALMAGGKYNEAISALEPFRGQDPAIDFEITTATFGSGDMKKAIQDASLLVSKHMNSKVALTVAQGVGALTGNVNLAQAASKALRSVQQTPPPSALEVGMSLRRLCAVQRACGAPPSAAFKVLAKAVHLSPGSSVLWSDLAALLAECGLQDLEIAYQCSASSVAVAKYAQSQSLDDKSTNYFHGNNPLGATVHTPDAHEIARAHSIHSCLSIATGRSDGLKEALRAVHMYPGTSIAWKTLATACMASAACETDPEKQQYLRKQWNIDCHVSGHKNAKSELGTMHTILDKAADCEKQGDIKSAENLYKEALKMMPMSGGLWVTLSMFLDSHDKKNAAVSALKSGISMLAGKEEVAALYMHLAMLESGEGYTKGLTSIKTAQKCNVPLTASCEFVKTAILIEAGKSKLATESMAIVLELSKKKDEFCIPQQLMEHYTRKLEVLQQS